MKIRTIDVQARECKIFNSPYFSGIITVNFNKQDEKVLALPYQYGEGDNYIHAAFKVLQAKKLIPSGNMNPSQYYLYNNIVARHQLKTGCKKEDLINV